LRRERWIEGRKSEEGNIGSVVEEDERNDGPKALKILHFKGAFLILIDLID